VGRDVGMGAGVERMIDPHVMLSLEYLYYGFDNVALTGPISPGSFLPSNYNVQVVRARFQLQVLNVD
jgi:opacity protein-like surface antigen